MHWKTKKNAFDTLSYDICFFFFGGLEQNLQYLWGLPTSMIQFVEDRDSRGFVLGPKATRCPEITGRLD